MLTLLEERLPAPEPGSIRGVVRRGDPARSLLALHRRLGLETHDSLVLRTIIFRESGTHPEVRDHLRRLRRSLVHARRAGGALTDVKGAAAVERLTGSVQVVGVRTLGRRSRRRRARR